MTQPKNIQCIEDSITQIMADVFGEECDKNSSVDTVGEWDSMKQLQLVIALESAYDVSFTDEEVTEMLSYELIKLTLAEHGVEAD